MAKITILLTFLLLIMTSCTAFAVRGVVVYFNYSKDLIVIETNMGYTCGEIYGTSYFLDKGHTVAGDLHSFGFHDIYDATADQTFRMYIDEYWESEDRVIDWVGNHQ